MGCGSSSDNTRHHPQHQHQPHQNHNPAVQPHPAAAAGHPPYPPAVLVQPYPQGAPAPYHPPQPNPPPPAPPAVYQPQQDASRGFRGHGGVATDADGWEQYDPSAFGGGGLGPVQGGGPHRGAAAEDEDAALAQAIARSLASAEEEQRQLRRAGVGNRSRSPPPPLPGRQHSAQVAFMTAPNEPFVDADLHLMPRVTYCAAGDEDDEGRQCALCFEEYADDPGAPLMLLPCFHRFHWKCAADWLKRKPECPVCKSNAKHTGASAILC